MSRLTPLVLALFTLAASNSALAVDDAHREAIQKLIAATRQKEQYEKQTTAAVKSSMEAMEAQVPEPKKEAFGRAVARVMALVERELSWAGIEDRVIEAYAEALTLEQVNELVPLMESEAMQRYLNTAAGISVKVGEASREAATKLQPQFQEIIMAEMTAE